MMEVMIEEIFGLVVGIMFVFGDEEVICFMNDSKYGLIVFIWMKDMNVVKWIGGEFDYGMVFMNCCDYLDLVLVWLGVKDFGWGCILLMMGYE